MIPSFHMWTVAGMCFITDLLNYSIFFKQKIQSKKTDETARSAGLAAGNVDLVLFNWKQIKCLDDL